MACVHFPIEFESLDAVRLLGRRLSVQAQKGGASTPDALAPLYAFRLWMEWALAAQEWRPLKFMVQDARAHNWEEEDVTYIIEHYCQWRGAPGALVRAALEAGLIRLEKRGEQSGLVLDGFWRLNEHLSPDFKTIQQRGGDARAEKRRQEADAAAARQRAEIAERNGMLLFGNDAPTEKERDACYLLIIRLDRATGRAARASTDHPESLMRTALQVVRRYSPEELSEVEEYLIQNRENPAVVKLTDRVLPKFSDYLEAARSA